jgi:hypothetical protein
MLRWMNLPSGAAYSAFDINLSIVELINSYFRWEGLPPAAEHRDVLCHPPGNKADVALLLKMYHCLERRRKGAGWQVTAEVPADWIAVSFPARSLTEKKVDIIGNYEADIRERCSGRGWNCRRLDFETEIVLLIRKSKAGELNQCCTL